MASRSFFTTIELGTFAVIAFVLAMVLVVATRNCKNVPIAPQPTIEAVSTSQFSQAQEVVVGEYGSTLTVVCDKANKNLIYIMAGGVKGRGGIAVVPGGC